MVEQVQVKGSCSTLCLPDSVCRSSRVMGTPFRQLIASSLKRSAHVNPTRLNPILLLSMPLQPRDGHALQKVHHQQPVGDQRRHGARHLDAVVELLRDRSDDTPEQIRC